MQRGLLRALPAALMLGFSAFATAAEIHDAVRAGDAAAATQLAGKAATTGLPLVSIRLGFC